MEKKTPHVIVFDGLDGTGKSTQIKRLGGYLTNLGYRVGVFNSPGTTPEGLGVRKLLVESASSLSARTRAMMMIGALYSVAEMVEDSDYDYVLLDRWIYSTYVYQGREDVFLKYFIHATFKAIFCEMRRRNPHLVNAFVESHTYFRFRASPNVIIARLAHRNEKNHLDSLDRDELKLRSLLYATAPEHWMKSYTIDADGTYDEVWEKVLRDFTERYPQHKELGHD